MREMIAAVGTLAVLCSMAAAPAHEKPYDFRKRLICFHEPNRRDRSAKPANGEWVLHGGAKIDIGRNPSRLLNHAAQDFCDYCSQSMGLNASIACEPSADGRKPQISVALDGAMSARSYSIAVTAAGVAIRAADDRAAAQALYRIEDRMNLRSAPFLAYGTETRRMRFSPRMLHSGWGCDHFPDSHLGQMAHYGMDAILVFVSGIDKTSGLRPNDVADIIRRAKAWGIDTYIYSYITAFFHPDDPGAKEEFEKTYGRVAAAYPEAKGIIFVGESCQFPSKDERTIPLCSKQRDEIAKLRAAGDRRPLSGWFPCRDYPAWLSAVRSAIHAHAPEMEIVFWTYNWGCQAEKLRLELIDALPTDITLLATFEMFESFKKRNGLDSRVSDYSLVFPGPGRYFVSEAKRAKERGIRMYSMTNTGGLTWDFGTIPYMPCPMLWKKRFDAVVKAHDDWNLAGLMENHHYGWWPNFIAELAKECFTEGGMPFDEHLKTIARRDFGAGNAERAIAAWKAWSDRLEDMHSLNENQYGPFRYGPAYPYNAMEPDLKDSDYPTPPMHIIPNYRQLAANDRNIRLELELLGPMADAFLEGGADFLAMAEASDDASQRERAFRMGWLGQYMGRTCLTAMHIKEGMIAERAKDRAKVVELARKELENCRAALELTLLDSRLGWEPTMLYSAGPEAIRWKMDYLRKHYGL